MGRRTGPHDGQEVGGPSGYIASNGHQVGGYQIRLESRLSQTVVPEEGWRRGSMRVNASTTARYGSGYRILDTTVDTCLTTGP